jgi:hypothetical protein
MTLDLRDCTFAGPAMPEPFVKYRLEDLLAKKKLLDKPAGESGKRLQESWTPIWRKLRALGEQGGEQRVLHHVLEPLVERLGWAACARAEEVVTREGSEDGGYLLTADGAALRAWVFPVATDLDAPNKRGRAYRFSPGLVAQRVLLAKGERVGLLTDGLEVRVLLSDPSGRDSHIAIRLDRSCGWRGFRDVPDSFRLLRSLCQPASLPVLPELLDEARLSQSTVTRKLREQARRAVERFIQGLIDDPANRDAVAQWPDRQAMAATLWHEGLVFVYRLLFILKLESASDPARAFSFAATSHWRNAYSPATALADVVVRIRDKGAETGGFLAHSLHALFRLFSEGLHSNELHVSPLGGMLFGAQATPVVDGLHWSEQACAELLDALLWTPAEKRGRTEAGRERVHYGALDVEDLGRVYESLLELEPGITSEPMCRLRRAKLEVVVSLAQGKPYRNIAVSPDDDDDAPGDDEDEGEGKGKTKVEFIEEIPKDRFYLRVGLGRKASGSYYTPHPFVRFLVEETLGPQVAARSPAEDPNPQAILGLRVLDPAMGSGHFLVEACRFLGDALYEACRLCDERALEAQRKGESTKSDAEKRRLTERAQLLWQRVEDLPDPNDELVAYLPSRILDGEQSGLSQRKARALCRRLVAVHCLYGVDKNPLAVELARVSLWLESYAEGLPLTFVDHRLLCGDSLTGPFFEHLLTYPGSGKPLDPLFSRELSAKLEQVLAEALAQVRDLEASIGKDVADIAAKAVAKQKLDAAIAPLKVLAAAWSGGVMLGEQGCDDVAYERLLKAVAERAVELPKMPSLERMIEVGQVGIAYDLAFPEVFHPDGQTKRSGGFHAVAGNPPWDKLLPADKDFFAAFDIRILGAPTRKEREIFAVSLRSRPEVASAYSAYVLGFRAIEATTVRLYSYQTAEIAGEQTIGKPDAYRLFLERGVQLLGPGGRIGFVVPSGFHANEGATGVRQLYLEKTALRKCFSFENRKGLFEIHRSFKFAVIVAERDDRGTSSVECAFYLHDLEWLGNPAGALVYTKEFIERTGGLHLSLMELRTSLDLGVAAVCFRTGTPFGDYCERVPLRLGRELNMTDDSFRFTDAQTVENGDSRDPRLAEKLRGRGYLPLHEGKTFHQFNDRWEAPPRYLVALEAVRDKPSWTGPARFFRVAFRDIASSTNERTGIFCLLPPGVLCGNTAPVEREPDSRANASALPLGSIANSCAFDWTLRQKAAAHVNLFILNGCPVPKLGETQARFLAHAALRLSCNHEGYAPLWKEQLDSEWREERKKHTWPVLENEDSRWAVRAAIDAVVAAAYGLNREQYAHVLASFSHKSYPRAPELCLQAFDDLAKRGLAAFCKKHDPYWDIPLVTTLPNPVLDLPAGEAKSDGVFKLTLSEPEPKRTRGAKKGARR